MSELRLGVVIPTWNEEELLPRLLERLVPDERSTDSCDRADAVVIADGGSTDATRRIARDAGVTVVESDRGRGTQLARGAAALDADVLLFLHADTLPESGAIRALRDAYADGRVRVTAMSPRFEAEGWLYRSNACFAGWRSRRGWVYGDCGLGVRRDTYDEVGGFRELELFEDVDLSRRLRRVARVRVVEEAALAVSARRWHSDGALRYTLRNWILLLAYLAGGNPSRLARYYRPATADSFGRTP